MNDKNTISLKKLILLCLVVLSNWSNSLFAQELEPRSLTNVPVGMNFGVLAYGYSWGNTLLDPSIPIEDLNSSINTIIPGYARAINFFGMSSKIDLIAPYVVGYWDGYLEGTYASASRNGFADPRIRFSFNFIGSPALKMEEFGAYKPKTIVGASIRVTVPMGQYFPDKLINLGTNRWTFKPQIGIAHYTGKWIFEGYISAWFYTVNNEFFNGNTLKVQPLYAVKIHVIRSLPRKMWIAFNIGYGLGGKTELNDMLRDDRISTIRLGGTFTLPLSKYNSLKFSYFSTIHFEKGPDFDAVSVAFQRRF